MSIERVSAQEDNQSSKISMCSENVHSGSVYQKTIIEDGASLGAGSVILCGIIIGRNAMLGAGSVVTRDIPPYSLAAGNPCRVIRKITEKDHM